MTNESTATTRSQGGSPFNLLPCDHYDHEYRACSSFTGRIDNYYRGVSISSDECARFRSLFDDCSKYARDPASNFDSLLRLNDYENALMKQRADASRANDVWQRRDSGPPSDWNAPLPDWCQQKLKESSWYKSSMSSSSNNNKN